MYFLQMIFSFLCFLSSICLTEGFATHCSDNGVVSVITGNLTCSYYMDVYVDGQKTGYNENRNKLNHQTINIGSNVIAVKCRCKPSPCGGTIIASFDNGLVTDTSWKCTTQLETGWYFEHFDDSLWNAAVSHGPNNGDTLPWSKISDISSEAHFIWTASFDDDHVVYCRKKLVEKCTKVTEIYFKGKEEYKGYSLAGHVMASTVVETQLECALHCSRTNGCVSFNLDNSRFKRQTCELNGATAKTNPTDLIRRNGFGYYETVNVFY